MIILEIILTAYVTVIMGTTGLIESVTGLYPAQQLELVRNTYNLPASYGVADTIGAVFLS